MSNRPLRARRTILAVPGSSERFIAKSRTMGVDCLFLDLEDGVAPAAKAEGRGRIVEALRADEGWQAPTVTYRVNDFTTPWTTRDVLEVVVPAGGRIDAVVLPKVTSADQVKALDYIVTQAEHEAGLPIGRIGFELQIEDAMGLLHAPEIAAASPRNETLVFGPGDWMASMGMPSHSVGSQPTGYVGDAYHHVLMGILVAARAHGLQAIDGTYIGIRNPEGFRASASASAALGYDGKWVIHPSQVEIANEVYSPDAASIERAQKVVESYRAATSEAGGAVGAIVVDDEMVDQAGVAVAQAIWAKARAAGMVS